MKLKKIEQKGGYEQITMKHRIFLFFNFDMHYRRTPDGKIYSDHTMIDRGLELLDEEKSRLPGIIREEIEIYEKFGLIDM